MNRDLEPSVLEAAQLGACTGHLANTIERLAVTRLCDALDAAFAAAAGSPDPSQQAEFARSVRAALAQAADDDTLLTPSQREGSPDCYRRHMLAADPQGRYAIVALVWQPGQASPVHGHHTWCGYAVLEGSLTETLYAWDDAQGCATPTRTHARDAGAVSYVRAGNGGIHRLGNTGARPAVSLHVYGVPGEQVTTHVNDLVRVALAEAVAA
ncbi:cysteine dioxygenase family protein [Trinickia fusca]|uniref:Cysteine dioxygenase n=1 Tax=Trinickia fusca TaxID=2419777 RepID=A0A494XNA9_9BURK|nr:cysteine dioxygenase family protein [Trinickia fusca]RKP52167.1 cysteine dioxygenase [Trinickia fusca]